MPAPAARKSGRHQSVIPGFGITIGLTLTWLALIVLIPLSGLFIKSASLSFDQFWTIVTSRRAINALKLSFKLSFLAAAINLVFGAIVAWVLVRYEFPGRRIFDAIVDIPFALPTAVGSANGMSTIADRKSTRLNSSHVSISYAVFCLKKKSTVPT